MRPSGRSWAGPRGAEVGGAAGPRITPLSGLASGQGLGLGAGRLQFHAELHPQPHFGCNSWLFLAARRSFGCVPWQRGRRSALGCLVGRFSGPEPLSCLLQAWPQAGQPYPRSYFGLSAWSWVSSAYASPAVADLDFHQKARAMLAVLSLVEKFFTQQRRALWALLLLLPPPRSPPPPPLPPPSPWSLLLQLLQQRVAF